MMHLVVRGTGLVPFSIPLLAEMCVGRHEKNDLVLADHRISRRHARFSPVEDAWIVSDEGSTHGTFVNGVRTSRHRLCDGDRIQLGNVLLEVTTAEEVQSVLHSLSTASVSSVGEGEAERRLAVIYELAHALRALDDSEELLERMLDAVARALGCERAMIGLGSEMSGLRRIVRKGAEVGPDDLVLSRGVLHTMLVAREAVLLGEQRGRATARGPQRSSAMGAPLEAGGRVLGFVYVDDRRRAAPFVQQDLDYLIAIARLVVGALECAEQRQRDMALTKAAAAAHGILGESKPIVALQAEIRKYGPATGTHVLIRGESGTGKELVAGALHAASPRASRPLIPVNCAAIPDSLIESELFGHVRGAFTGALRDRKGSFELASGSTLFLDEIGDLSLPAQAKLLRAIQEGEILPVGSERLVRVDVRIIAATHKDLLREIEAGRFREDLYYRIAVIELMVPPLRERTEDIEPLAHVLLEAQMSKMGKRLLGFTPAALDALRRYRWPGNVRELKNEVELSALNAASGWIDVCDLRSRVATAGERQRPHAPGGPVNPSLSARFSSLEEQERALVVEAVETAGGNLAEAARLLGITRQMMRGRVERFSIKHADTDR
ncbi:sigma 54-interacting transcriptional regulator [Polyangium sp. 6x1]|uniref:sigma 54-interacting transcriptional regulator n=1 Tax=Polyangium sp. 6x1 TaxID=3042689 RepID=UPI0024829A05|nr:sigma 54-interacting transcriptional regulator [Polyangium sp. 6x1]MDI1449748.1 sigma 54-interacting transcriptional regulator [Polyangium sp. 6x1]